jgi:membrane-associated phospholipid phosphatase
MSTSEANPLDARPTRWQALRVAVLTSVLFLVVYGTMNHLASLRSDVGTWVYSWEQFIPFVPLMIVPYMSIDLLFVIAPFLCTDRRELRQLARRLTMAVIVSGAFFLAMPLRFTFERPQVDGVLGLVFNNFLKLDKPFNLFPSLHITLRTILADTYARHTRGWLRVASDVWFSLIGASTLLVYQHHVIDVAGGFVLAALVFYAISDSPWRSPVSRNRRVGAYYAIGALVLAVAAWWLWPWGGLLLWPALACALVASGYFGVGAAVYRKAASGRLPLSMRVLMAPVLLAQWLSLKHYARRSRRWDCVTDRVWVGRALSRREARDAMAEGVTAVLDLTGEFAAPAPFRDTGNGGNGVAYLNVPILDLTAPLDRHFTTALAFIDEHANNGGIVYVHCKAGYSRSAAIVAAHLVRAGHAESPERAVEMLRKARSGIIIRPESLEAIRACCRPPNAQPDETTTRACANGQTDRPTDARI